MSQGDFVAENIQEMSEESGIPAECRLCLEQQQRAGDEKDETGQQHGLIAQVGADAVEVVYGRAGQPRYASRPGHRDIVAGVLLSAWILGDQVTAGLLGGMLLVAAGLVLIARR